MKKQFIFFIVLFTFGILPVSAFQMLDNSSDVNKSYLILDILPIDAVNSCDVFINNGAPIPITASKTQCEYYKNPDSKIKIEVRLPFESIFRNKTFFVNENKNEKNVITIQLSKKLSEISIKVAKMTTDMINAILKYSESKDIREFRKATSSFSAAYYVNDFIDELSTFDEESILDLVNLIKQNIDIPNSKHELIFNKIIDNMFRIRELAKEIKELKAKNTNMTDKNKKEMFEKMTVKFNEIIWDTYDIVKAATER